MNSSTYDDKINLGFAEDYYNLMLKDDFVGMGQRLDPQVSFLGPLAELSGREAVIEAAKNLRKVLKDIKIRSQFSSGDQVVLVSDFIFSNSIGVLRSSTLMSFKDHFITSIELFYDARPFDEIQKDIFQNPDKKEAIS